MKYLGIIPLLLVGCATTPQKPQIVEVEKEVIRYKKYCPHNKEEGLPPALTTIIGEGFDNTMSTRIREYVDARLDGNYESGTEFIYLGDTLQAVATFKIDYKEGYSVETGHLYKTNSDTPQSYQKFIRDDKFRWVTIVDSDYKFVDVNTHSKKTNLSLSVNASNIHIICKGKDKNHFIYNRSRFSQFGVFIDTTHSISVAIRDSKLDNVVDYIDAGVKTPSYVPQVGEQFPQPSKFCEEDIPYDKPMSSIPKSAIIDWLKE